MNKGLSTYRSLHLLVTELKVLQRKYDVQQNLFYYFKLSISKGILRHYMKFLIFSFILLTVECFYNIAAASSNKLYVGLIFVNATFVYFVNFLLVVFRTKSICSSLFYKFHLLIDDIQHVIDNDCRGWKGQENYLFVTIPFANSVNLQWTLRDGQLVNLPVALLVKGDVIRLRPGQAIFADCAINPDENDDVESQYLSTYSVGQTFVSSSSEMSASPDDDEEDHSKIIPMKSYVTATVTVTPIISLLDEYFVNNSGGSKGWWTTVPERYVEFGLNVVLIVVLVMLVGNVVVSVIWFVMVSSVDMNIYRPSSISFIILLGVPLQLPLILSITTSNTIWTINCLRYKVDRRAALVSNTLSVESIPSSVTDTSCNSNVSGGPTDVTLDPMSVSKSELIRAHWDQIVNQNSQFVRMVFSMGSLTSVCCVDKKGILADPIATPEKLFIYRKRHRHRANSLVNLDRTVVAGSVSAKRPSQIAKLDGVVSSNSDLPNALRLRSLTTAGTLTNLQTNSGNNQNNNASNFNNGNKGNNSCLTNMCSQTVGKCIHDNSAAVPVILDISRSTTNPFMPSFDDSRWERYLSSLKPIGLNILLNNCNPTVSTDYIKFIDSMCAINFKHLNKSQLTYRCICGLSALIGFKNSATDPFSLKTTFAVCRKNENQIQKEISVKSQSHVYAPPVSIAFAAVVEDSVRHSFQLMSQGSADLLLTMCTYYWDGKDICLLTQDDRSRLLDFYNRNIFSSYCIAFSYSPIINKVTFQGLENKFILQMNENDQCLQPFSNNKPIKTRCGSSFDDVMLTDAVTTGRIHSSIKGAVESIQSQMKAKPSCCRMQSQCKAEDVEKLLKQQIFLGMISLQVDQVQSDVIDCINHLEQACIRFVFFSVDNQLRSRVFAERLGMESGWNCHISLAESVPMSSKPGTSVRRNSSKNTKNMSFDEGTSKADIYRSLSKSEPNIPTTKYEPEQIVHSTTFTEKDCFKLSTDQMNNTESKTVRDFGDYLYSNSTSDSMTSFSSKKVDLFENPEDHFPEDKSKLPCGIKSIRPHLENIDNVPLQVSLFTDCNAEVNNEMMNIMREYGEIICCCGSGLGVSNIRSFAANDCAVAFVPIFHKQCFRQVHVISSDQPVLSKVCCPTTEQKNLLEEMPMLKKTVTVNNQNVCLAELSPINIACRLTGMPCALILNRKAGFSLIAFITECHRLVKNILACVAFYCIACLSYGLLKLLVNVVAVVFDSQNFDGEYCFGLDQTFFKMQILYHLYVHVPVLAFIVYTRVDMLGKPLKEPPRKRVRLLTYKQCLRFLIASIGRFLPSVIITLSAFVWNLKILYPSGSSIGYYSNYSLAPFDVVSPEIGVVVSDFLFVQYNIYILIVSFFYITLEKPFWKVNLRKNYLWPSTVTVLTLIQPLYLLITWGTRHNRVVYYQLWALLSHPIILSIAGMPVVFLFGILSNNWEAKALAVEYRLTRLYFGTKLGMYSPV